MDGPNDPQPSLVVEDGVVVELDGRARDDFDVIDFFLADHGLDLDAAAECAALDDAELARRMVDVSVPRDGARAPLARPHAGPAGARRRRSSTRSR